MQSNTTENLYRSLVKVILLTAGLVILIWFLYQILSVLLLLLLAIVLALIINNPVTWLEKKKVKRAWGSLMVFGTILLTLIVLGWFIGPKISEQTSGLFRDLPEYGKSLSGTVSSWFSDYPDIQKKIEIDAESISESLPSVPKALVKIGNFSLSLVGGLVVLIVFISMVIYAVADPRPLVELYLSVFPPAQRGKAVAALSKTSVMLGGWIKANLIGGTIEAVLVTTFLSIMDVPGAFVWGALALFAELIPKIGFYIMSIPPILVALTVDPVTALWVTVFFLALNEIMGDMVMPKLRSSTMNIHPVSTLFLLLAMGSAFGFLGALMATPFAAIIKSYYEAFYLSRFPKDHKMEEHIEDVIQQKIQPEKE
ncbi:AI-2E family transporter [Chryseobacterium sp.]|uniref:AI-2E family transporter n=1 Tax=Chryseobacterium sp. TaxID=1871047 RepID=UPI0011CBD7C5|nr:AI-2E family transporter [Chryseobacterium sp.]TXF74813.1 AI-2E family transporter [Chryseobacterium sp.]